MSLTVGAALAALRNRLADAGIDGAGREARLLLAAALAVGPDRITLMERERLPEDAAKRLEVLAARRAARVPMAQILGRRAFFRHEFRVTPDVLDPRPETEVLVRAALDQTFERVLDLGTGTGCILLSLLAERPGAQGMGTDVSDAALDVARANAADLGVAERCRFIRSDWFAAVEGRFDLIVSNPPYVAADEMAGLAPELAHEPRAALTDEGDGLSAYRAIAAGAGAHLVPGGRLMVEIGHRQWPAVRAVFERAGLADIAVLPDLDGRDRVVTARKPR